MSKKIRIIAEYGLLIALALVLSIVESFMPAFFAVPGMKLGLTNVVVVVALYYMKPKDAIFINIIRIVLVGMMFSNGASFLYSICGGLLSGLAMILLYKTKRFSMVTISVVGGIMHNVGQILCAMVLLYTSAIGWYLAILWVTGLLTGALIGLISGAVVRRLPARID